jgi:hypothetical protein
MEVTYIEQQLSHPKRVCLDNTAGQAAVSVRKGEILAYDLAKDNLNYAAKLSDTAAENLLFAGISRKNLNIAAGQKGYLEIDEPGSITEAFVLDAGVDGVAEHSTLKWKYHADYGGVLLESAGAAGCGTAVLLEAVAAANPAVVQLKKVYLDKGNRQISA